MRALIFIIAIGLLPIVATDASGQAFPTAGFCPRWLERTPTGAEAWPQIFCFA